MSDGWRPDPSACGIGQAVGADRTLEENTLTNYAGSDYLEYYETWKEEELPDKYRGSSSLRRGSDIGTVLAVNFAGQK